MQVGILQLEDLMQPVNQFHVRIAAQFAEHRGAFDALVAHPVQLAEQFDATYFSHARFSGSSRELMFMY